MWGWFIIENINNASNLLKNVPLEFLAKLNITQTLNENPQGEVEVTILYGEPFEVVKTIVENIGGRIEDLG